MTDPSSAPQESKADKFKRLAEPRVNNALAKIALLGNLTSSSYEFTAEQAEKILTSLKAEVEAVEQKFQKALSRRGYNDQGKFKL